MSGTPPRGVREGTGLDADLDTIAVIRDCLYERCWQKPSIATLHTDAVRLAMDFRRRGLKQDWALGTLLTHFGRELPTWNRERQRQIEKAVEWAYSKEAKLPTCNGVLKSSGLCFKLQRRCEFDERMKRRAQELTSAAPQALPFASEKLLSGAHPTDIYYAKYVYAALAAIERERGIASGKEDQPILVGLRVLAERVCGLARTPGFEKTAAQKTLRLLCDVGLVRQVVKGSAGRFRRKANGYIRVMPVPTSVEEAGLTGTPSASAQEPPVPLGGHENTHRPPKLNPESRLRLITESPVTSETSVPSGSTGGEKP